MTVRKEIERVVLMSVFPAGPPAIGAVFASDSSSSAFVVSKTRLMFGRPSAKGLSLRVFGHRVRMADLPPGTIAQPWPKAVTARSRAAEMPFIGPPVAPPPIVTLAVKQVAERKRIIGMKRAANQDATGAVPQHQIATGHAQSATWRDPDDIGRAAVLRRNPREVSGFRATDAIKMLYDNGAISRKQSWVADRLRRAYEQGVIGMRGGPKWDSAPSGFGPGAGPSEIQCQHLERYNQAMGTLGRLGDIVLHVCVIGSETLTAYATRAGLNRQVASGRLGAALCVLEDHYERLDDAAKRRAEASQQPVAAQ